MNKKGKLWVVEYRYFKSTGEAYNWRLLDRTKSKEDAQQLMKEKRKCFPFCEFRAIGPSKK